MSKIKIYILPALLFLSACSQNKYGAGNSVRLARAGNAYLTLEEALETIPAYMMREDSIQAIQTFTKEWVEQKLLLQKAQKSHLADKENIQRKLQNARERVLKNALRQLLLSEFDAKTTVSDAEALRYYRNNREQFILQERYVQFRHVSTANYKYARAARSELLSGKQWPEVANLFSKDAEQRIKQSQKYWPQSMVLNDLPVLKQYIADLDSGQISPVRQLKGKYHFVQLTGSRAAGKAAKPAWIMDQLKEWIMLEKKRQFFKSYVKNLYLKAKKDNDIEFYDVLNLNETQTDTT